MKLRNLFLVCSDLERSGEFYELIGLAPLKRSSRYRSYDLGGAQLHLHAELTAEEAERYGVNPYAQPGNTVVCLEHPEVEKLSIPEEFILRPLQETPWNRSVLMLRDPDGYLVELST